MMFVQYTRMMGKFTYATTEHIIFLIILLLAGRSFAGLVIFIREQNKRDCY